MLQFILNLRCVMLVASLGAGLSALVMLWQGCAELLGALRSLAERNLEAGTVISFVLGATDAFLLAIVLLIFAFAIALRFVIDLSPQERGRLAAWMRISGESKLMPFLVEVILVYLVVDFATDVAGRTGHLSWRTIVKPASILLIAAALRFLSSDQLQHDRTSLSALS